MNFYEMEEKLVAEKEKAHSEYVKALRAGDQEKSAEMMKELTRIEMELLENARR